MRQGFQTGHFADSKQLKIDSHFTDFGQDFRPQKTIQTISVLQKIREPRIGSGTSHFQ